MNLTETASRLGERLSDAREQRMDLGRRVGEKLNEARQWTAEEVQGAASSVRTAGRHGSETFPPDERTEVALMQLDKAFEFAVVLAWRDLLKVVTPSSVRVEYRHESESLLDHVTLWADKGKGYCDRVCDYWTWASATHANGIRFWRGHDSDRLARSLDFIMKNQDHFTGPTTARDGLVLVYPPGDAERAEAASWAAAIPGTAAPGETQYSLASSN